jgi:hypothetical protein
MKNDEEVDVETKHHGEAIHVRRIVRGFINIHRDKNRIGRLSLIRKRWCIKKINNRTNPFISIQQHKNIIVTWFYLNSFHTRHIDSRCVRLICQQNSGCLHLKINKPYNPKWSWTQNPNIIILTYVLRNQNCLQNIAVREIHLLLHVHGSYPEIEPQTKQIFRDLHMMMIIKWQTEGHKWSRCFNGSHFKIRVLENERHWNV